ncbi:hypothetical protein FRB96_000658 [Tulasnella sp. 330]|nr:hypothetical protein FRB96_000658 [Tulasnella sp. 330]
MSNISTYLNRDSLRQRLGVDKAVVSHSSIAYDVHERFVAAGDCYRSPSSMLRVCLGGVSRSWFALVSVRLGTRTPFLLAKYLAPGDYGWICNWIGNKKWTELMKWTGQAAFVGQKLKP